MLAVAHAAHYRRKSVVCKNKKRTHHTYKKVFSCFVISFGRYLHQLQHCILAKRSQRHQDSTEYSENGEKRCYDLCDLMLLTAAEILTDKYGCTDGKSDYRICHKHRELRAVENARHGVQPRKVAHDNHVGNAVQRLYQV